MADPKISKPITTISGKYYAGMKKAEAQKNASYKKMIGIDFKDIDKNKDGVLSPAEICDARDKEVKRGRTQTTTALMGTGMMVGGSAASASGIGAIPGAIAVGIGGIMSFGGVIASGIDGLPMDNDALDAEVAKTAQYRAEHGLNIKM